MRRDHEEDLGCVYPLDNADTGPPILCGAARRPGSSFCPEHHVLCHIPAGSRAECRTLDEAEPLARVVGGRAAVPPRSWCPAACPYNEPAGFFHIQIVHVLFTEEA
jgi:hypothetical protein